MVLLSLFEPRVTVYVGVDDLIVVLPGCELS
jgi:hypothetical protein